MDSNLDKSDAKYLKYLPLIYQPGNSDNGKDFFLGRFLKAFEKILSGRDPDLKINGYKLPGIEEILDSIHGYFDPYETPVEFLPWLASWVALTLGEGDEWDEAKKRRLIAQIVPLYKKRGTVEGLKEYLEAYFNEGEGVSVSISEFLKPLRVGTMSTIGLNTVVGEGRPYYFQVYVKLPINDRVMLEKKVQMIMDIIKREKPAHTYCMLIVKVPSMKIAAMIGEDTLLGGYTMVEKSYDT